MPNRTTKKSLAKPSRTALKKLLTNARPKDLRWRHEVGRHLRELYPDRVYGDGRIKALSESLRTPGSSEAELRKMRGFAVEYTTKDVNRLLGRFPNGFRFSWAHVSCLLRADRESRPEWEKRCQSSRWSCIQLRDEIQSLLGKGSAGGRKHVLPSSADAALKQLKDETEGWLRRYRTVWLLESRELRTLKCDSELLSETIKQLAELAKTANEAKSRLEAVKAQGAAAAAKRTRK